MEIIKQLFFKNISLLCYSFLAFGQDKPRCTSHFSGEQLNSQGLMHWQAAVSPSSSPWSSLRHLPAALHFALVALGQPRSEEHEPLEVPVHLQIQKASHLPTNLLYSLLTVLGRTDLGELKKLFVVIETAGLRATVQADTWGYYCLAFFQVTRLRNDKKL